MDPPPPALAQASISRTDSRKNSENKTKPQRAKRLSSIIFLLYKFDATLTAERALVNIFFGNVPVATGYPLFFPV
jgi:hypothetical protein